jgi:hypothetical protein
VLETRAAVENVGPAPVRVALQSRFELNPGTTGDADVLLAFSSRAGAKLEKQLLGRGLYTGGSEWYERESAPADAWQLRNRVTGLVVTCGLAPGQVERSFASWRPRGENRASMADWSPEVVLAPGQRTELRLDYALRRGQ